VSDPSDPNNPTGSGYPGNYPPGGSPAYPGYPRYPGYPGDGGAPRKPMRGRRAIQVGAILIAVGIVLVIVGGVLANTNAYSKVNDFQRVAVKDRTGTVTFNNAGGYVAYYESSSVTSSTSQEIPLIPVRLTNRATGQAMTLTTTYGDQSDGRVKYLHYDHDGHKGLAMWQFHIDQTGTYGVELGTNPAADADAAVAFGKSIAGGVVLGGAFVIAAILVLIAGVIVLIVGLVKRSRNKRELRTGGGYGGFGTAQPSGWPPGSGMQGWPPAGGQPQQWPQPGGQPPQQWPQPGGQPQQWPPAGGQPPQQWPQPGDAQGWGPPPQSPEPGDTPERPPEPPPR
jgi:uncharacterized membrane protein